MHYCEKYKIEEGDWTDPIKASQEVKDFLNAFVSYLVRQWATSALNSDVGVTVLKDVLYSNLLSLSVYDTIIKSFNTQSKVRGTCSVLRNVFFLMFINLEQVQKLKNIMTWQLDELCSNSVLQLPVCSFMNVQNFN